MYSIDMLAPFWLEEDMYLDPKYDGMYLHSHAFAMAVAFGSILSKEFLYRKTIKIAKLQDSKVLEISGNDDPAPAVADSFRGQGVTVPAPPA